MKGGSEPAAGLALLPVLAVVGSTACFQFGAAFAKGLYPSVGPIGASALRILFAALILLVLVRPWRAWPARPDWLALLGLGTCVAGAILFFYLAIAHLPLGIAISIQSLGPLTLAACMAKRALHLLWVALAGLGIWCLVGADSAKGALEPVGLLFALIAAACWAGYILCGRRVATSFGAGGAALSLCVAALLVVPVGMMQNGVGLFAPALLPLALLVAILSAAIPLSLELYALPRLPARNFAVLTSLEPAFAVLAGLFMLGERLSAIQLAGIAMVVTASMGSVMSRRKAMPA
ncbi:EamA family transporter [Sphingobium sp. B8D3C]|uniref:EamA family transporter n=1 Tax=Sphingobium sp. B8D3C TaxID=2940586 RepID=UPI00222446D0|nr:EamA family transporter [Sphingobium sp. B8D3C]MCW2394284.1 inner membrane transporter RhtA [Sphingobium sp. B8D3B]MCW2417798.1 inner membrane transporter RhtA [Sphingobium sp. B8D3C]